MKSLVIAFTMLWQSNYAPTSVPIAGPVAVACSQTHTAVPSEGGVVIFDTCNNGRFVPWGEAVRPTDIRWAATELQHERQGLRCELRPSVRGL